MALGDRMWGQKTMLDVLVPVLDELRSVRALTSCPRSGGGPTSPRGATVPMVARQGRAAFLGERSRGAMDPGCAIL